MTRRSDFLNRVIGDAWDWRSHNCWTFTRLVQRELFGRELPDVAVPMDYQDFWARREFARHPERAHWSEVKAPNGIVTAGDGALVLMAKQRFPGHIGTWLKPEQRVIHCGKFGVVCEPVLALRQSGYFNLSFFEHVGELTHG
ncbi:hypothetical protein OOZ54_12910 [Rhodopseudomonas palustris]|uniref:hypothetical protein n=1 Tax=Rhodopseudomonas palustris TaxID=1076 RepID=UPI0022F12901|nr:hypothetical protein [Rhodopseudomonas palustris]WBU27595.1 hypothetical protein OOZ54_12910 [Rhodopseudomonas palustris]